MLSAIRRITVCAILLWLVSGSTAYAQPDTVTTATGEKIVGEINKRGEGHRHDRNALFRF